MPGIESYVALDFENLWRVDLTFIGGLQVDCHGNTNMIGLKGKKGRLQGQGPGTVGTATLTTHIRRYFIYVNEHSSAVFVPRCDYISSFGVGHRRRGCPGKVSGCLVVAPR